MKTTDFIETGMLQDYVNLLVDEKRIDDLFKLEIELNQEIRQENALQKLSLLEYDLLRKDLGMYYLMKSKEKYADKTYLNFCFYFWIEFFDRLYLVPKNSIITKLETALKHVLTAISKVRGEFMGETAINISELIREAKNRPIREILNLCGVEITNKRMACCIKHNEKSPSMYIYEDTNTWHCFGCGESGDNIDLVEACLNMNFIEAVKFLSE